MVLGCIELFCSGFWFFAWVFSLVLTMLFILIKQDLSQCVTCQEKHITVKKEPHESLGMTVAGGRGSKSGELPIFVTSVQPHGCLARDGRIKRGGVWPLVAFWSLHSLESGGVKKSSHRCRKMLIDAFLRDLIMEIQYLALHFNLLWEGNVYSMIAGEVDKIRKCMVKFFKADASPLSWGSTVMQTHPGFVF